MQRLRRVLPGRALPHGCGADPAPPWPVPVAPVARPVTHLPLRRAGRHRPRCTAARSPRLETVVGRSPEPCSAPLDRGGPRLRLLDGRCALIRTGRRRWAPTGRRRPVGAHLRRPVRIRAHLPSSSRSLGPPRSNGALHGSGDLPTTVSRRGLRAAVQRGLWRPARRSGRCVTGRATGATGTGHGGAGSAPHPWGRARPGSTRRNRCTAHPPGVWAVQPDGS